MSDETPATSAEPTPAAYMPTPSGQIPVASVAMAELKTAPALTIGHVVTGLAGSGVGIGGYELFSPLVHWAVTGGVPDADAQRSLSLLATMAAGAFVTLAHQWLTRARPVQAVSSNGDKPNA